MPRAIKADRRRRQRQTRRKLEVGTLEGAIRQIAFSGQLTAGVRALVDKQRAAGLAITYQRGNDVVREHPDGRIEVIAHVGVAPSPERMAVVP